MLKGGAPVSIASLYPLIEATTKQVFFLNRVMHVITHVHASATLHLGGTVLHYIYIRNYACRKLVNNPTAQLREKYCANIDKQKCKLTSQ